MSSSPAETLTRLLLIAVQQTRHYGRDHRAASEAAGAFAAAVADELSHRPSIRFDASGDWLTVQGMLLPPEDRYAPQLRDHLRQRRAAHLALRRGVSTSSIRALVRLLALDPEELIAEGGLTDGLAAAGAAGIAVERAVPAAAAADPYQDSVAGVAELWAMVERSEPLDVGRAHLLLRGLDRRGDSLWSQVLHRGHDELDPAHAVNTAFLTLHLARALDIPDDVRAEVGVAALIHDMGIAVLPPAQRLAERTTGREPGRPRHAIEGGYLLRHSGGRERLPMIVALEHHDAVGGSASSMLPHSRLVALADHVDAMTCGRAPGIRATSVGRLLTDLLAGQGPAFDPLHVRALCAILREAGNGSEIVQRG